MCSKDEVGCELAGGLLVVVIEAGWRPTSQASKKQGKERGFYGELGGTIPSNWRHLLVDIQLIHQLGFVGQCYIIVRTNLLNAEMKNDVPRCMKSMKYTENNQ